MKIQSVKIAKENWLKYFFFEKKDRENFPASNVFIFMDKHNSSDWHMSMTSKFLDEKPAWFPCRSSIKCIWNALNRKQKQ